jgi:hypothetical protein
LDNLFNVFICSEGGCSGNFLATLVRIFKNPEYINNSNICARGSADFGARSGHLHEHLMYHENIFLYEGRETQQKVDDMIRVLKSDYYYDNIPDYDKQHGHVNMIHYLQPMTVSKLLKVPDLKVIYVSFEESDCKLIAKNKILKNFNPVFKVRPQMIKEFKAQLTYFNADQKYHDEFDNMIATTSMVDMTSDLTEMLIELWEKLMLLRIQNTKIVSITQFVNKENLLIIKFKEILGDKNLLLDKLSNFLNLPINEELSKFYDDFNAAQQYILNYQEQ